MKITLLFAFAALAVGAAPALADSKTLPGMRHNPPKFVDEATVEVMVVRNNAGYGFNLSAVVAGAANASDRARVDWKQGGKLLATGKCELETRREGKVTLVSCEYRDKPLLAKGAVEADLIYSDDKDGNDYLLRTFKLIVAKYPSFGDPVWQLVPDDLLGAAWAWHYYPQKLHDSRWGHPHLLFWVARDNYEGDAMLRCTIDGAKQPDIKIAFEPGGSYQLKAETHAKTGGNTTYSWLHLDGTMDVYFGKRADYRDRDGGVEPADTDYFLAEHAGAWQCQVRSKGVVLRELLFTVDAKGFITSDLQTAKGAAPTLDSAAIDLRFPKGVTYDTRVRPDAMKKSRGFGLPWPDSPSVKASQATFPPASGLADPK